MSIEESFLMFLEHNFVYFDMALQGPINHRPKFLKGSVDDACKMFMTLGGIFGCHITIYLRAVNQKLQNLLILSFFSLYKLSKTLIIV